MAVLRNRAAPEDATVARHGLAGAAVALRVVLAELELVVIARRTPGFDFTARGMRRRGARTILKEIDATGAPALAVGRVVALESRGTDAVTVAHEARSAAIRSDAAREVRASQTALEISTRHFSGIRGGITIADGARSAVYVAAAGRGRIARGRIGARRTRGRRVIARAAGTENARG